MIKNIHIGLNSCGHVYLHENSMASVYRYAQVQSPNTCTYTMKGSHIQVPHMYICKQYIRNRRLKENKMGQFDFIGYSCELWQS